MKEEAGRPRDSAATIPDLGEHFLKSLLESMNTHQFAFPGRRTELGGIEICAWQDATTKSHLRRLADTKSSLGDAANLARKPDFTEHGGRARDRAIADAGRDGGEHAEIGRRLVHCHPPCDVDENVFADEVQSRALFKHGQE